MLALEAKKPTLLETAAAAEEEEEEKKHILENGKLKWQIIIIIITREWEGVHEQNPRWVYQVRCCAQIVSSEVRASEEGSPRKASHRLREESFLDADVYLPYGQTLDFAHE